MRNWTIRFKIIFMVIVSVCVIALVSTAGILISKSSLQLVKKIVAHEFPNYIYLRDIGTDIHQAYFSLLDLSRCDPGSREYNHELAVVEKNINQSNDRLDSFKQLNKQELLDGEIEVLEKMLTEWSKLVMTYLSLPDSQRQGVEGLDLLYSEISVLILDLEDSVDRIATGYGEELARVDEEEIHNINVLNKAMRGFALGMLSIMIVLYFVFFAPIIKRIKILQTGFKDIEEGEGNLKKSLDSSGKDEISLLSRSFNVFIKNLHAIIARLVEINARSVEMKNTLNASSMENQSNISKISFNLKSISEKMIALDNSVKSGVGHTKETTEMVGSLLEKMNDQTEDIEDLVGLNGHVAGSIENIDRVILKEKGNLDRLSVSSRLGYDCVVETTKHISNVNCYVEDIENMVVLINDISSKTNILAMNAAIEAAHAGESGRGFSVVANEIRKLAEESSANSKNIKSKIVEIVDSINNTTQSTATLNDSFSKIENEIGHLDDGLQMLVESSAAIIGKTHSLKDKMGEIRTNNRSVIDSFNGLNSNQGKLQAMLYDLSDSSNAVSSRSSEALVKIDRIEEETDKTVSIAHELGNLIDSISRITERFSI